jgi:anti-anti-sigma factor
VYKNNKKSSILNIQKNQRWNMLDISLEFVRGMLFVRLEGVLDSNTCSKLSDCLDTMIHEKELKYFVINLEYLDYIDESGLQSIIDRYFDVALHDGKLVVCGYNNQFKKNLEIENVFDQIERTSNELGALKLINL